MSRLIFEAVPKIEDEIKSDMYAFLQLRNEGTHNINFVSPTDHGVLNGFFYTAPRKVNCATMKKSRAGEMLRVVLLSFLRFIACISDLNSSSFLHSLQQFIFHIILPNMLYKKVFSLPWQEEKILCNVVVKVQKHF